MPKNPIKIAIAKDELKRINDALDTPHLLIGGLAVERYHKGRDSQDIDLVCSYETAKKLLRLYPSNNWYIEDRNDDDYRPSYEIKSQVDNITIIFGPKISEREPYNYLDWEDFKESAICYTYKDKKYDNILIPNADSLAFTKLVSAVERKAISRDKSIQDFEDFINLSNNRSFNINRFVHLLKRAEFEYEFIKDISKIIIDYSDQWELSNIKFLIDTLVFGIHESDDLRNKMLEISKSNDCLSISGAFPISKIFNKTGNESEEDLINRLKSAENEFIAFGLTRNFYADKISDLLIECAKKINIKIFLMNPDCSSRIDRYRIEPIEASFTEPSRFKSRIINKYKRLIKEFDKTASGSLEVYFYDFPCSFALEKIDSSIRVMLYGHGVRGTDSPIFIFDKNDKYFDYFNSQLEWLIKMGSKQEYDEARGLGIKVEKLLDS